MKYSYNKEVRVDWDAPGQSLHEFLSRKINGCGDKKRYWRGISQRYNL